MYICCERWRRWAGNWKASASFRATLSAKLACSQQVSFGQFQLCCYGKFKHTEDSQSCQGDQADRLGQEAVFASLVAAWQPFDKLLVRADQSGRKYVEGLKYMGLNFNRKLIFRVQFLIHTILKVRNLCCFLPIQLSVKASLHIRFPNAFSAMRCFFITYLDWEKPR